MIEDITPGDAVKEFLKRRAALSPGRRDAYKARMTGPLKTNKQIGAELGKKKDAIGELLVHVRKKGLPVRESAFSKVPTLPNVSPEQVKEHTLDIKSWKTQLGIWHAKSEDEKRPIVVRDSLLGVMSISAVNNLAESLKGGATITSRCKILMAQAVYRGLISLEDLSRLFFLHDETVLAWIEQLQDPKVKALKAAFSSDIDITPLCAKLLIAAQNVHSPLTAGPVSFDVTNRVCRVNGSVVKLHFPQARLLLALCLFPGRYVDNATIYSFMYADVPAHERPTPKMVMVAKAQLLKEVPSLKIDTVYGLGHRISYHASATANNPESE